MTCMVYVIIGSRAHACESTASVKRVKGEQNVVLVCVDVGNAEGRTWASACGCKCVQSTSINAVVAQWRGEFNSGFNSCFTTTTSELSLSRSLSTSTTLSLSPSLTQVRSMLWLHQDKPAATAAPCLTLSLFTYLFVTRISIS